MSENSKVGVYGTATTTVKKLLPIYLTTRPVMLVFTSKLTLGTSRTLHAQTLLRTAVVVLFTLISSSRSLDYEACPWFNQILALGFVAPYILTL